jgi:hypothetical protein
MSLRLLFALLLGLGTLHAANQPAPKAAKADDPFTAALRAADDERVAAIKAADAARLNAIFSDALRYTHSNGDFDTKSTYIGKLVSGATKYTTYQYSERTFTSVAPTIAVINGRVRIIGHSEATPDLNLFLSVLMVYRLEEGKWRFLAWQSAKLPLAEEPTTKKK